MDKCYALWHRVTNVFLTNAGDAYAIANRFDCAKQFSVRLKWLHMLHMHRHWPPHLTIPIKYSICIISKFGNTNIVQYRINISLVQPHQFESSQNVDESLQFFNIICTFGRLKCNTNEPTSKFNAARNIFR